MRNRFKIRSGLNFTRSIQRWDAGNLDDDVYPICFRQKGGLIYSLDPMFYSTFPSNDYVSWGLTQSNHPLFSFSYWAVLCIPYSFRLQYFIDHKFFKEKAYQVKTSVRLYDLQNTYNSYIWVVEHQDDVAPLRHQMLSICPNFMLDLIIIEIFPEAMHKTRINCLIFYQRLETRITFKKRPPPYHSFLSFSVLFLLFLFLFFYFKFLIRKRQSYIWLTNDVIFCYPVFSQNEKENVKRPSFSPSFIFAQILGLWSC